MANDSEVFIPDQVQPAAPAAPASAQAPAEIEALIQKHAARTGVDANFLRRQLQTENAFKPTGTSSKGAQGIAQIMPATAQAFIRNFDALQPVAPFRLTL